MSGRLSVDWKTTLSDGHFLQVVRDEQGRRFLEIIGETHLETEGDSECVRLSIGYDDAGTLRAAIGECEGRR